MRRKQPGSTAGPSSHATAARSQSPSSSMQPSTNKPNSASSHEIRDTLVKPSDQSSRLSRKEGLNYLDEVLQVDTYQRPSYHKGTSIPADGWIQPCSGCRSWTSSTFCLNPTNELPLCKRCLLHIMDLQQTQVLMPTSELCAPACSAGIEEKHTLASVAVSEQCTKQGPSASCTGDTKHRRWSEADLEQSSSQNSGTISFHLAGVELSDHGLYRASTNRNAGRALCQYVVQAASGIAHKRRAVYLTP